jgi:hypothetical protein
MQRLVALLMLVCCACLVAGCGGSALQTKARKVVGDPHATVVSTETVRGLNGQPVTVVVLKPSGSTGLGCIEASGSVSQTVTSSLVPGCPRSSDAYVEFEAALAPALLGLLVREQDALDHDCSSRRTACNSSSISSRRATSDEIQGS